MCVCVCVYWVTGGVGGRTFTRARSRKRAVRTVRGGVGRSRSGPVGESARARTTRRRRGGTHRVKTRSAAAAATENNTIIITQYGAPRSSRVRNGQPDNDTKQVTTQNTNTPGHTHTPARRTHTRIHTHGTHTDTRVVHTPKHARCTNGRHAHSHPDTSRIARTLGHKRRTH